MQRSVVGNETGTGMARKIDGISYPDNVLDILRNATIGHPFHAFVNARNGGQCADFLAASVKPDPKQHFDLYFSEGGLKMIPISAFTRGKAYKLGNAMLWNNEAGWLDVYATARKEVAHVLQVKYVEPFFQSSYFSKSHQQNLSKRTKGASARLSA